MARVDQYNVFQAVASGTGAGLKFATGANSELATQASIVNDNTTGSNTNILGDVPYDSFSVLGYDSPDTQGGASDELTDAGGAQPLLYLGYVSVNYQGTVYTAAVGENLNNSPATYFLFAKVTDPAAAFLNQPASAFTFTANTTTTTPGTEYLINTEMPYCFLSDTMLRTPSGDRAVETLRAGDLVMTASGVAKPIRWIGRTVVASRFADRQRMLPVRISAGALAENVPSRDLFVSPGHAIGIDGVLVHASALVNGKTIVRETSMPLTFTYFHVETEIHELLIAENTPAESFLEAVADVRSDNHPERAELAGTPAEAEMTLPRVKAARQVPASIRAMIVARASLIAPELSIAA